MEMLSSPRSAQHLREILLQPGINPDQRDKNGDTPLHVFVKDHRDDRVDLIITLLTHSCARVDLKTADSMTALHLAVMAGDLSCMRALMALGADANALGKRNQTPLDLATSQWAKLQRSKTVSTMVTCEEEICASAALLTQASHMTTMTDVSRRDDSPSPECLTAPSVCGTMLDTLRQAPFGRPRSFSTKSISKYGAGTSVRQHTPSLSPCHAPATNKFSSPVSDGRHTYISQSSSDDSRDFLESMLIRSLSPERDIEVPPDPGSPVASVHFGQFDEVLQLLYSVGAQRHDSKWLKHMRRLPELISGADCIEPDELLQSIKISDFIEGRMPLSLCEQLTEHINSILESGKSLSGNIDEAIAISFQEKDIRDYKKTKKEDGIAFTMQGGSRILVLDGGGMKGLVEIEVLAQLEEHTGKKVTELFDWIIGTSTGGIVALALVYAGMTVREVRQLYFKMKDAVFANPKGGVSFNSSALQEQIIKTFGINKNLSEVKSPKVLIAAVNKRVHPLELHFFNNCFEDDFSNHPVWKVARYTSATPILFTEFENYVDGGVLANNPSNFGLTAIQKFYSKKGQKLPIATVVSLGTGVYPPELVGDTRAEGLLYFGPHWFNVGTLVKNAKSLISVLTNALVESEIIADDCKARCREQGIPFFRFSPHLDEAIAAGEVENENLITMIIRAKQQTWEQGLPDLLQLFWMIAEANRKKQYVERRIGGHIGWNTETPDFF